MEAFIGWERTEPGTGLLPASRQVRRERSAAYGDGPAGLAGVQAVRRLLVGVPEVVVVAGGFPADVDRADLGGAGHDRVPQRGDSPRPVRVGVPAVPVG